MSHKKLKTDNVEKQLEEKRIEVQDHAAAPQPEVKEEKKTEKKEDRSAFNCPSCKGSGLQDSHNVCLACNGTGKTN